MMLEFSIMMAKIALVMGVVLTVIPFMVWFERRGSAWIQGRVGPNRVGPFGLLQPVADVAKFLFKENFIPKNVSKFYYLLAPTIAVLSPMVAFAVIPFGSYIIWNEYKIVLQITQLNLGILFIFAVTGLEVYSIMLAGWASNNKYAILGSLRGSSQVVSYEIAMGLAIVSVLMMYGNVDLQTVVALQDVPLFPYPWADWIPRWGVFTNPIACLVFLICIFAETNRLPFDLPEGEAEIVAGYHLEYASVKFALFFMAEYIAMTMASALFVTLFLGGYNLLPGMDSLSVWVSDRFQFGEMGSQNIVAVFQMISFTVKVAFMMFFYVWVRWTFPRFRFDQLMNLGWKTLLPISLVNLVIMSLVIYWRHV